MIDLDTVALQQACAYCEAPAGQWCVTDTGNRATNLHAIRRDVVNEAYAGGYVEGMVEQQAYIEHIFTNFFLTDPDLRVGRQQVMGILNEGRKHAR